MNYVDLIRRAGGADIIYVSYELSECEGDVVEFENLTTKDSARAARHTEEMDDLLWLMMDEDSYEITGLFITVAPTGAKAREYARAAGLAPFARHMLGGD